MGLHSGMPCAHVHAYWAGSHHSHAGWLVAASGGVWTALPSPCGRATLDCILLPPRLPSCLPLNLVRADLETAADLRQRGAAPAHPAAV